MLPLRNLGADAGDDVLADATTEELITLLARVGGLRVIASTSVFAFRERRADVRSIADSLCVFHLLEGGSRRAVPASA